MLFHQIPILQETLLESFLFRMANNKLVLKMFAIIQKIPFPFAKIPLRVDHFRMRAQTLDRFLAVLLWKFGLLENFESTLLKKFCRPGMRVIDVGANIGFYTLTAAHLVGENGSVLAFEPEHSNFKMLQQNLSANSYSFVTPVEAAISDKTEKICLFRSNAHYGDHRIYQHSKDQQGTALVQAYALDDFLDPSQTVDIIKMDIQGAEGLALLGMTRLLERSQDIKIFMEFWPEGLLQTGNSPQNILNSLVEMGFLIFEICEREESLELVSDFERFVQAIPYKSFCNLLICRKPLC